MESLFRAFSSIVERGEGFAHLPPLSKEDFSRLWLAADSDVVVARLGSELVGASYLRPNFVGRAAHIANAGYFVLAPHRGRGLGRALVLESLGRARRLGFDAVQFNLVAESNPARALYESLGFTVVGRIPRALGSEDALVYWRALEDY